MKNYQIGGSLGVNASSYVIRKADTQLYEALLQGEFCYVFNCRQMGKSSLRVRVKDRLEKQNYACVSLDMSNIGSKKISPLQWYKSIASELWRGFNLMGKVKFKQWWEEQQGLSPIQQLDRFVTDVIMSTVTAEKLFIFIDEIDSVISLDFPTDDFFALIRYFYNQRAENKQHKRLSFALFGVATPSDLIRDRTRTPFNIGTAIELTGFTLKDATPLVAGLEAVFDNKTDILQEILYWTGGQPFLTQKVCKLVVDCTQEFCTYPSSGYEADWVKDLVTKKIIKDWVAQDEPEHLKTIRDRLLRNEQKASCLLKITAQICQEGFVVADDSIEQKYLLLSNLVVKKGAKLIYRNPIYQQIFNLDWIEQQQANLLPFNNELNLWLASKQSDRSRLLRGQALKEALEWATHHSLSQIEYQFITASQVEEQETIRRDLEFKRLQELEAKLTAQKQIANKQNALNITLSVAVAVLSALSLFAYQQFRRAIASEHQSKLSEVIALASSAKALFASEQKLDALIVAIDATQKLDRIPTQKLKISKTVNDSLSQAVQGATEYNRLTGHDGEVWDVAFSPDGNTIISAGADNTIRLWSNRGRSQSILRGHTGVVRTLAIGADGKIIASGGDDGKIQLWNITGEKLETFLGHNATVQDLTFSPNGKIIASVSADGTLKLWDLQGQNIKEIANKGIGLRSVAFSPDGKKIAVAGEDNLVTLWNKQGKQLQVLKGHSAAVLSTVFSPDGQTIITAGDDNNIKLWHIDGTLVKTIAAHTAPVRKIAFSPDGKTWASASADNTIKIWTIDGQKLKTIRGHTAKVRSIAFSPDSQSLISASSDRSVRLWRINGLNLTILSGHQSSLRDINFSPDGKLIATAGADDTAKIWNLEGKEIRTITGHDAKVAGVAFSHDGNFFATASFDNTVKIWTIDGREKLTLKGHLAAVRDVVFSPDGSFFATASADDTVKIWNLQGKNIQTFQGNRAGGWDVDYSPDGTLLASASEDGTIKIWSFRDRQMRILKGHTAAVLDLEFSPDGKYIASGSRDNTVKLWNLEGKAIATFQGHQTLIRDVAFSPNGKYIASASGDNTVKIWNLEGEELSTFKGHNAAIRGVAFSPDGKLVASASEDSMAIIWNLEQMLDLDPLEYACNLVEDYLETNIEVTNPELCQDS